MESKVKVSEKVFSMCEWNKQGRGGNGEVKKVPSQNSIGEIYNF